MASQYQQGPISPHGCSARCDAAVRRQRRRAALNVAVVIMEKYNVLHTVLVFVATPAPTRSGQETKTKMKWKRKQKQMWKMTRKLNIVAANSALIMNGNDWP